MIKKRPLFSNPLKKRKKMPHPWGRFALRLLKRVCMAVGALVLISGTISMFLTAKLYSDLEAPALPEQFVLYLPLEEGFVEHHNEGGPYALGSNITIREVVETLDKARKDDRVKGLVSVLQGGQYGLSHIEELRAALKRFRDSGKFAYIYASSYGEIGRGLSYYYLASAYDEIWVQPLGVVSIDGIRADMPFLKAALEEIGIEPEFQQRKSYKSVFESFTASKMSPETREATTALLDDIGARMVREIAADRDMSEKIFKQKIDQGLFTAESALNNKLVDTVDYSDVLTSRIKQDITGDPDDETLKYVGLKTYKYSLSKDESPMFKLPAFGAVPFKDDRARTKPTIALIYAVGTLMENKGGEMTNGLSSAEDVSRNIVNAFKDDDVQAIILRVNSPGGTPAAAERIRRAVIRAQEAGKPVIVSMGPLAASGGYWVSAEADYIFASANTLTGSIGVAGGKFVIAEMWKKLDINWDAVSFGKNADYWSFNRSFTPEQEKRFSEMMDATYNGFVERVARGRGMSLEEAENVAQGRVWTGAQAFENGLVDQIGGLDSALDHTSKLLGKTSRHDLDIITLPRTKTTLEKLAELLERQVVALRGLEIQAQVHNVIKPFLKPFIGADMPVYSNLPIIR